MLEVRVHSFNIFVHGSSMKGPAAAARTKVLRSTPIKRCGIGKICAGLERFVGGDLQHQDRCKLGWRD